MPFREPTCLLVRLADFAADFNPVYSLKVASLPVPVFSGRKTAKSGTADIPAPRRLAVQVKSFDRPKERMKS